MGSEMEGSATPSLLLIPKLPDDVAIQCIARVPRRYHSHLCLVSKSWRSLLRSPLFFSIRSELNTTQDFVCLNLRLDDSRFKWLFIDYESPSPRNVRPLPPIPIPFHPIGSALAVLGPQIFVIGGSINEIPSPHVWIFDSRFDKWEPGPKMRVAREFAAAGVVNGKLYVVGGCLVDSSWARSTHCHWAEVYDPLLASWASLPTPLLHLRHKWMHATAVLGNNMYAMADRGGIVFCPDQHPSWASVPTQLDLGWRGRAAVVHQMIFCYDYLGNIRAFDPQDCIWKELRGLDKDLPKFLCGATMLNVGDQLCVVWEGKRAAKQIQLSCAKIHMHKDTATGELSGSVVSSKLILALPAGSSIIHCLSLSL